MIYFPHEWQTPFAFYRYANVKHWGTRRILVAIAQCDDDLERAKEKWQLYSIAENYMRMARFALNRRWSK